MRLPPPLYLTCLISVLVAGRGQSPARAGQPESAPTAQRPTRAPQVFLLPAADAGEALAAFARQTGTAVVYVVEHVQGVRTNRVDGRYSPREALERLVANTPLTVVEDSRSGALMLKRTPTPQPTTHSPSLPKPNAKPDPAPPMKSRNALALIGAWLIATSGSEAQTTPANSPAEETVQLSTFTVNADKDSGYQATDTIVGGRLKTNLLQTPSDVTVLTREFLDDLAVTSLDTAGNWMTGSDRAFPTDGNTDFGAQTGYRSLGSGTDTRNGFRYDTTMGAYAVERMEGARGSNAILFGDAPAGGQTNFTTKMARFRDATELTLRTNSERSRAAYLDYNRKLSPNLAVRLNTLAQQTRTWVDRYRDDRYGLAAAVTYRPWKNGEIRFDGSFEYAEVSLLEKFQDQVSKWDGVTVVSAPLTTGPAAVTGVGRFSTDKLVWLPSLGHLYNFNSFGQTTGSALLVVDDPRRPANFPTLSRREFSLAPPDEYNRITTRTAALFFNHAFGNGISIEIAGGVSGVLRNNISYNISSVRRDINLVLPRLASDAPTAPLPANPNFGKYYTEGTLARSGNDQVADFERASVAYEFNKLRWLRQLVGVNASNRITWYYPYTIQNGRTNGTNPDKRNAANVVTQWRYWDNPGLRSNFPETQADGANIGSYYTRRDHNFQRVQTFQMSTVGYYWGDKISLVAGWRRDRFRSNTHNIGTYDALGDIATYNDTNPPIRYNASNSIGLTYFPIKAIGFYANHGGGLQQGGSSSAFLPGKEVYFSHSTTKSWGLRARLFEGRIVGRIGTYDSRDRDRAVNLTLTNINNIWNAMGHPENRIQSPFSSFADTLDYHGWGQEAEVTVNVTKAFRLTANLTLPRTQQVNARKSALEYINTHRKEWENAAKGLDLNGAPLTGANVISPAQQATITTNLPSVYDLITGAAEGRTLDGTFKYRGNFFGVFSVPGEKFAGLSLGGGANLYGKRQIGNQPNQPFIYVYNEASYTATAFAAYKFKLRGRPLSVQLNIENLMDWNRPVYSNTSIYQPNTATPLVAYRNAFNYVAPRNFILTMKYEL